MTKDGSRFFELSIIFLVSDIWVEVRGIDSSFDFKGFKVFRLFTGIPDDDDEAEMGRLRSIAEPDVFEGEVMDLKLGSAQTLGS